MEVDQYHIDHEIIPPIRLIDEVGLYTCLFLLGKIAMIQEAARQIANLIELGVIL
jgi:hypothetical protein